jgi:hypothetical protein
MAGFGVEGINWVPLSSLLVAAFNCAIRVNNGLISSASDLEGSASHDSVSLAFLMHQKGLSHISLIQQSFGLSYKTIFASSYALNQPY